MYLDMVDTVRGMLREQMRMEVISSNLANASTYGFKKTRFAFQDLLEAEMGTPQAAGPGPRSLSPSIIRTAIDFSQGDIQRTGNSLDLAIQGEGFFQVMTPDGVMYTRKGNFSLDNDRFLVTQNGEMVLGEGGPILIDGHDIEISGTGEISSGGELVGIFALSAFENTERLFAVGGAMFSKPEDEPEIPVPFATRVKQGFLELPNVNIVEEMVSMIHSTRAFESYQKAIQILDEVNQRAINDVSRIR